MFKYILLPVFFLFTFHLNSSPWDTTAAKYYPLAIGNVWVYQTTYFTENNPNYIFKNIIIGDTVIAGRKYFTYNSIPVTGNSRFERVDSSSMNVYYYDVNTQSEKLLDSLLAKKNNWFSGKRLCVSFCNQTQCTDTFIVSIFNIQMKQKKYHIGSNFSCDYNLIENIGVAGYYCYEITSWGAFLKGCIINGVVYGDTSTVTGIIPITGGIPNKFLLHQNYPNPFNPNTTITFEVPHQSEISVKLYDSEGRLIRILFTGIKSAGIHSLLVNGSNLASGIYFYSLEAEGIRLAKKLLIIK